MNDPSSPSLDIARHRERFRRNRDFIEGEFAVKACGTKYLPKITGDQSDIDYAAYKLRTQFFPAASRTLDGLVGLIFRKRAVLTASAAIEAMADAITGDRASLDDLAVELVRETFVTNYSGLWVDHPPTVDGLTEAQAAAIGAEPYVDLYPAESILEVRRSITRNRRSISYVRLLVDAETVRELELVDGVYQTVDHIKTSTGWVASSPVVPLKSGKPLNAIPFVLVSTNPRSIVPEAAELDKVISLNHTHYLTCADLANSMYWSANPIVYAAGVDKDTQLSLVPGSYHIFDKHEASVEIKQFDGSYIPSLQTMLADIEDHIAQVGLRILSSEKAAAEAAETLAIRRAGETSILAAHAKMISRKITEALEWVSFWLDSGDVEYHLNSDFDPSRMSAPELSAYTAAMQGGAISRETFFEALQDGELVRPALTFEEEQSRLEVDALDRPATEAVTNPLIVKANDGNDQ